MTKTNLVELARVLRYWILLSTTTAGSGHPSSSLSAVELMATLYFGGFARIDLRDPKNVSNDQLVWSKGHAAPLLYALLAAAGVVSEKELITLRHFESRLDGHPNITLPYVNAATGSLGQGLSIGVGMAQAAQLDGLQRRTFVLLGDSEMSEGSNYEALQLAAKYKLNNLVGIIDVNRLGQTGATMYGSRLTAYQKCVAAFGWRVIVVADGHNLAQVNAAFRAALRPGTQPTMIIARTIKGKGVKLLENKNGWHGKAVSKEDFTKAVEQLGAINLAVRGTVLAPKSQRARKPLHIPRRALRNLPVITRQPMATRKAFGIALVRAAQKDTRIVALDVEMGNSTFIGMLQEHFPERFIQNYIAEQHAISAAVGLSRCGKVPFVATFASFLTRAHDQLRIAQFNDPTIKVVGSHAGVSIGEDGASQMGLDDLALFRALHGSSVLYPADAVSCASLVQIMTRKSGLDYLRTTRMDLPVLYKKSEKFAIGGSKTLRRSHNDQATIVAAGITVHEALKAARVLQQQGIAVRVIDCYSVKPIDVHALQRAAQETQNIIVVEDHYPEGGLADAVRTALGTARTPIVSLAVSKLPRGGAPERLLAYEQIDAAAITQAVLQQIGLVSIQ